MPTADTTWTRPQSCGCSGADWPRLAPATSWGAALAFSWWAVGSVCGCVCRAGARVPHRSGPSWGWLGPSELQGGWVGPGNPGSHGPFLLSGAGEVRSVCPSIPIASTPASTSATNCRHPSPGIWLRALTGESSGLLGEEGLSDPRSLCFSFPLAHAGCLVLSP